MQRFYSNGKLLLTAEYLALDGALALALPTKFGQTLEVKPIQDPKIIWSSYDENDSIWYACDFILKKDDIVAGTSHDIYNVSITTRLLQILNAIKKLNPNFPKTGYQVKTRMNFPRIWGLGSSSTLINNLAQWSQVDAYTLLEMTFGGSGYDIACAQVNSPLTYRIQDDKTKQVTPIDFNPSFADQLYFIHLNKKQDSRQGIAHYVSTAKDKPTAIKTINRITEEIVQCKTLSHFQHLINEHEMIISNLIQTNTIKESLFSDYKGSIKSLGAWGGDFILATGSKKDMDYFKDKGYSTIIPYTDMIL